MKKEVHYLTYYNSLIKVLSLTRLYYMFNKCDVVEKDNIINEIEKVMMETLNHFENVNFNRPNYFYKESKLTPIPHLLFILKSSETDNYLFIKNDKGELDTLNYYPSLFNDLNEEKEEIVVHKLKIDKEYLPLIRLKTISFIKPIEDDNLNIPLPEYLLIFKGELPQKDIQEILSNNSELVLVDINDEKLKSLDKKPINLNSFKKVIDEVNSSNNEEIAIN